MWLTSKRPSWITGASGNLGRKLSDHWRDRYELRLLDLSPRDHAGVSAADLAEWDPAWVAQFAGVDAVVHLAADPQGDQSWANLVRPNMDMLINVFTAAAQAGVPRLIYASSNHVLGSYRNLAEPAVLTHDTPPRPGVNLFFEGYLYDSTGYGGAKLMGERLGKCFADIYGLEVIAVRIGFVHPDDNSAAFFKANYDPWFQEMWLSTQDYQQLMDRCLTATLPTKFHIVNGMSRNEGMRWDIEHTRRLLGYEPQDGLMR